MLSLSFLLLLIAAVLGGALAALHLKGARPAWPLGALHGLLAAFGLVALLLALRGPPRGAALGIAGFGKIAAGLATVALLMGLAILFVRVRHRRVPAPLVGSHATVAIAGVVVLAAYVLLG